MEDAMNTPPAAHTGPQWIDPALAPCLHKLAPFGQFVFYPDRNTSPSGPPPDSGSPAAGGQADEDTDPVLDTIEGFVTGVRTIPSPGRFLGTVLFMDVADSTRLAAEIGDSQFGNLLSGYV